MKKILPIMLICLLFLCPTITALANGYGLSGGIYDIVTQDDDYDGYVASADDGNLENMDGSHVNHAILGNRYHRQLIAAIREDGRWVPQVVSTTAVYQPEDDRARQASLEHMSAGGGFILRYGDESYSFERNSKTGEYYLSEVRYHEGNDYGTSLLIGGGVDDIPVGYGLWQGGLEGTRQPIGDAIWEVDPIPLQEFNITLLPRTLQDVRQMGKVSSRLALSGSRETLYTEVPLGTAEMYIPDGRNMKLPVYAAPDEKAYRAANGKASVSTGGHIKLLGEIGEWTMVSYEVSNRTSRIGFVHANLMAEPFAVPLNEVRQDLFTIRDTYLTDDPDVSQYAQLKLPAGTRLTGLAVYGRYYAYVSCEDKGVTYWGFVPLKDLTSPAAEQDLAIHDTNYDPSLTYRWDIADLLVGKWMAAEANYADPAIVLYAVGGFGCLRGNEKTKESFGPGGIWRICDIDEPSRYNGAECYTIIFEDESNTQRTWDLILEDGTPNTITLVREDEQLVYERSEYSTYGNG